jgi:hypothetical protein
MVAVADTRECLKMNVENAGTSISKEMLIDLIKKSSQQTFTISQSPISKQSLVIIS